MGSIAERFESPKVNALRVSQGREFPAKPSGLDLVLVQWERMERWDKESKVVVYQELGGLKLGLLLMKQLLILNAFGYDLCGLVLLEVE